MGMEIKMEMERCGRGGAGAKGGFQVRVTALRRTGTATAVKNGRRRGEDEAF
jgi:hypothetical protein